MRHSDGAVGNAEMLVRLVLPLRACNPDGAIFLVTCKMHETI